MEDDIVIVAATRTAVGKFGGSLAKISAAELGAKVIKSLLQKTELKTFYDRLHRLNVVAEDFR